MVNKIVKYADTAFFLLFLTLLLSCGKATDSKKEEITEKKIELKKRMIQDRKIEVRALLNSKNENETQPVQGDNFYSIPFDKLNDVSSLTSAGCGTKLTADQYDTIMDTINADVLPEDTTTLFTCHLYVFTSIDKKRKSAVNKQNLNVYINTLRDKFAHTKIDFVLDSLQEISNSFYDFNTMNEHKILALKKDNVMNVFVTGTLFNVRRQILTGYTNYSSGENFIILSSEGIKDGITFSHEMGHYFNLYHTHGPADDKKDPYAFVNGENCIFTGDEVCDTPADPYLIGKYSNCIYTGNETDLHDEQYKPDLTNIMSYAGDCRSKFTKGQYNRIRISALRFRKYILVPDKNNI